MRFAEILGWRWTPAFALVGGALLFVLLAVALVPDELGAGLAAPSAKAGTAGAPGSASAQAAVTSRVPRAERPKPARRTPIVPSPRPGADPVLDRAPELPVPPPYHSPPEPAPGTEAPADPASSAPGEAPAPH